MSVDECIAAYEKLASKIFDAGIMSKIGNGASTGARFSSTVLEEAIKEVVKQTTGNADASMRDPKEGCAVYVTILLTKLYCENEMA